MAELVGQGQPVGRHRESEAFGGGFEAVVGHNHFLFAPAHEDGAPDELADVEGPVGDLEFGAGLRGAAEGDTLADDELDLRHDNRLASET